MSLDRRRQRHSARRQRSSRSSTREQSEQRTEPVKHDSDCGDGPIAAPRSAAHSHPNEEMSSRKDRRRSQRRRSHGNLPSPPIETPITSVLSDLREDIEESNFSPQHTSTFYGDWEVGEDALMRGRPHGPVYVESRSGFSQISRERAFDNSDGRGNPLWGYWHQSDRAAAPMENKPVHLAISVQSCWMPLATFCHGVLAGLSLTQTIFVEIISTSTSNSVAQFAAIYGKISQLFSSLVYILISLCLVSVFDRMDVSHADCRQFLDILSTRPRISWLLVPLYSVALVLTFLAARTDDWLATRSSANISWTGNTTEYSTEKTDLQMFEIWRVYNILRCTSVVLGWLILATARPKDLLLHHLKIMLPPLVSARMP